MDTLGSGPRGIGISTVTALKAGRGVAVDRSHVYSLPLQHPGGIIRLFSAVDQTARVSA